MLGVMLFRTWTFSGCNMCLSGLESFQSLDGVCPVAHPTKMKGGNCYGCIFAFVVPCGIQLQIAQSPGQSSQVGSDVVPSRRDD